MSVTLHIGELELGETSPLQTNSTTDHPQAGGAWGGTPRPPRRRRRTGGGRLPSRKEELVRELALFASGFAIALLVAAAAERRKR